MTIGRRQTEKRGLMRSNRDPAHRHRVAIAHHALDLEVKVWECRTVHRHEPFYWPGPRLRHVGSIPPVIGRVDAIRDRRVTGVPPMEPKGNDVTAVAHRPPPRS